MRTLHFATAFACVACAGAQELPLVNSDDLQALIDLDELRSGAQQLQDFAYAYPERNRVYGGQAHNDTINFLAEVLEVTGYYDVTIQPFNVVSINSSTYRTTYRTTYNVIAETKGGDHNNVLVVGAHTDSAEAGPGINDNGSGTIGILNVATSLTNFSVANAVRFCFWSAEEAGLLGSTYYVFQPDQTAKELAKVRAYLNFDMIASPNYAYLIFDGDGSTLNAPGPPGSAGIERLFEDDYTSAAIAFNATAFDNSSDYGPFLKAGIPAGGVFTSAGDLKTEEGQDNWGGVQDLEYDGAYHRAEDDISNLALDAFWLNTKLIAHGVATYARSFDSFTQPKTTMKRSARHARLKRQT